MESLEFLESLGIPKIYDLLGVLKFLETKEFLDLLTSLGFLGIPEIPEPWDLLRRISFTVAAHTDAHITSQRA